MRSAALRQGRIGMLSQITARKPATAGFKQRWQNSCTVGQGKTPAGYTCMQSAALKTQKAKCIRWLKEKQGA